MLLQVARQVINRHSIDARTASVSLHTLERLPEVEFVIALAKAGIVQGRRLDVDEVLGLLKGGGIPRGVVPLAELPRAAWGLSPAAFLSLGLIVLIATPFVRVAGSLIAFAREGDRRYVVLTGVVLAVMCVSVLLGRI